MPTTNLNATRIARTLRNTEHAIDEAIIQGADYLKQLIEARREHNLAAEVGHEAVAAGIDAMHLLSQARGAQIRSHTAINEVAEVQGIGWRLSGATEGKIEPKTAALVA